MENCCCLVIKSLALSGSRREKLCFYQNGTNILKSDWFIVWCHLSFRVWFSVIVEEGSAEFVSELVPVLLERTGLLYGVQAYKADIRR